MKAYEGHSFAQTPEQALIEKYSLKAGSQIRLIKNSTRGNNGVSVGDILHANLTEDAQMGHPLFFDNGANTSEVTAIVENQQGLWIKTRTSLYQVLQGSSPETIEDVPTTLTQRDLDRELAVFDSKGYAEWAMFAGRVPAEDNPYHLLLKKNGFHEGTKVLFFAEREREGVIQIDSKGELMVRDTKGNPWGLVGILQGGYIKKVQ